MRYILVALILTGAALAVNWTPAPALESAIQDAEAEFWTDWEMATADSIEVNGVNFAMPPAVRAYYREQAIASWQDWMDAIDAFKAHVTS